VVDHRLPFGVKVLVALLLAEVVNESAAEDEHLERDLHGINTEVVDELVE